MHGVKQSWFKKENPKGREFPVKKSVVKHLVEIPGKKTSWHIVI